MNPFYDLNKRLATLASKQDQRLDESKAAVSAVEESKFSKLAKEIGKNPKVKNPAAVAATIGREKYGQKAMTKKAVAGKKAHEEELDEAGYSAKAGRAGKDLGKPGKNFAKIAKGAAERYGSKEAGERVAGAVLNKLRHPKKSVQEGTCPSCNCNPCECVEEGNAFTGKLKATPKDEKFKLGDKTFKDTSDIEEGFKEMDAWLASREKEKGTGKFDKKERTLPGGMKATTYTRKHEDDEDDDKDAPEAKGGAPKKKGRPKGKDKGPERVTAKSYKYKAGRPAKTNEGDIAVADRGEYDDEAGMAKDSLHTIVRHAKELESALRSQENLPEWVQEKIGQIKGMMSSVSDYILSTHERDIEQHTGEEGVTIVPEVAPPGAKAERMVKHIKKAYSKDGKLTPKEKAIAYATTWKAKKAGKVEEEGSKPDFLDVDKDGNKKETFKKAVKDKAEKKVDETTVAGSVATATTSGKSAGGSMQFGKGVYEGFNSKVENMIAESIDVTETVTEHEQEGKTITVTASGAEADMLMQLLKMAGLSGQGQDQDCGCGNTPCSCEEVDEAYGDTDETLNNPDWPTSAEKSDNAFQYSGGLNGPKSTGQSTTVGGGIPNYQARRQVSMEESVKLERSLFKTWKNYKG